MRLTSGEYLKIIVKNFEILKLGLLDLFFFQKIDYFNKICQNMSCEYYMVWFLNYQLEFALAFVGGETSV